MSPDPAVEATKERTKRSLVALQAGGRFTRRPGTARKLALPYPLGAAGKRMLRALILALCPPSPAPRSAELLEKVELGSLTLLRYMHPVVAWTFGAALVVVDWLCLVSAGARFHRLAPERGSAVLRRWARGRLGPLRLAVQGFRSLVLSMYFDQDEVHRALGYAPVPFLRRRSELRGRLTLPVPIAAE